MGIFDSFSYWFARFQTAKHLTPGSLTELALPKWVLIVWQKVPQMPQSLSARFVCPCPKALDFNEKRLQWASVVRVCSHRADINVKANIFIY